MRFRPCIDLHDGRVKQIVGATLRDDCGTAPETNFEATRPPEYFAELYRRDALEGGHVIMLGPGNTAAAAAALRAYPGGLQLGGGVRPENAQQWLDRGANKVIVTSYAFRDAQLDRARLDALAAAVGRERLVLDVSCRRVADEYVVVCDRWQTRTDLLLSASALTDLCEYASEFLIHAVDVEGRQRGPDPNLVRRLADWTDAPVTYAGGIRSLDDVRRIEELGRGRIDVTVGSALDIFGGTGLRYADLVALDRVWRRGAPEPTQAALRRCRGTVSGRRQP